MPDLAELNLVINSAGVTHANNELKVLIQLGLSAEASQRRLGQVSGSNASIMGGLANSYSRLHSILLKVAAGAGAVGLALKAVQLAGAQEQRVVGFTTLLKDGEAAQKMLGDLRKFANETPFEFPELAESAKKMLAFGFSAKEVVPLLREVGDAASGLGGGAPLMDQIVRALGQMQAKGRVSFQEMNQLSEAGIPAWQHLADAVGAAEGKLYTIPAMLDKVEKGEVAVGLAMKAIREGLVRDFSGGMAAQSKTLLGLFSTLKDEINTTMTGIGETIIEVFGIKGKMKEAIAGVQWFGIVAGDTLRILAGMPPKNKELSATSEKWAETLKTVGTILGIIFGAKMLVSVGEMTIGLLKMVKTFSTMSVMASPILTLVLAIGVALSAWSVGETIFNQFKRVRLYAEDIRYAFEQITDAAGKFNVVTNVKELLGFRDMKMNRAASEAEAAERHNALRADIEKEPESLNPNGSFGEGFSAKLQENLTNLRKMANEAMGSIFGDTAKANKEANKMLEDLTSTKKKDIALDKQRTNSADIYIEQLKRETANLADLNVFAKYQNDIKEITAKLDGELVGTDKEKAAAKQKYVAILREEIMLFERAKVEKEVNSSLIAQQRELAIISKSYGDERMALLEVEKLLGKHQQDGITFTADYIDKLKQQNLELIRGQKEAAKLDRVAEDIGNAFGNAFDSIVEGTKSMSEVVLDVIKDIEKSLLRAFVTQPITDAITGYARSALGGIGSGFAGLFGGGAQVQAQPTPHALGGFVTSPTFFNYNGARRGLAGERGTEVIMPVGRGPDGRMGVVAQGGDGGKVVHQTINITTPDADSFRRSRRQLSAELRKGVM